MINSLPQNAYCLEYSQLKVSNNFCSVSEIDTRTHTLKVSLLSKKTQRRRLNFAIAVAGLDITLDALKKLKEN